MTPVTNSRFAIVGVSCSADSFVVKKSLMVHQIWLSLSAFVMKIATLAKPQSVVCYTYRNR